MYVFGHLGPNINMQRFRGGLVSRLINFVYHSTLGLRVIKKKKKKKKKKQRRQLGRVHVPGCNEGR